MAVAIDGIRLIGRRVFSGAAEGDKVGILLANGLPKNAGVVFSLTQGNDTFRIVGNELQVHKVAPHKRTHRRHRLRVKASYLGAEKEDVFNIKVLQSPKNFVLSQNQVTSGSPDGTVVGVLRLPGLDRSVAPVFELLNAKDTFRIRGVQVEVSSVSPVHVRRPRHTLRVQARYAHKVWEKTFNVEVTPKDVQLAFSSEKVLSDLPAGASVGRFYLKGLHASVPAHFELLSGKDSFRLAGKRLLVGNQAPSHRGRPRHRIRVKARYKGKEIQKAFRLQVVTGQVALALSEYKVLNGAKENARVGRFQLQAPDANASEARYTLLNGTDTFKINGQALFVATHSPTYTAQPIHKLRVRINQGGIEYETALKVEVLPSLENIQLSVKRVQHEAPIHSFIGHIHVDGIQKHIQPKFEIVNPTPYFQIKNQNELHVGKQSPNYFQQHVHNLIVRASYAHSNHQKMFAIGVSSPPLSTEESGDLTIYPDPTTGPITFTGAAPESVVYIYDTEGDLVDAMALDKEGRLNLSHLPDRAYVLEVFDVEGVVVRRTIIKSN